MNDITIFNHLGNDIRVMTDEQGEPLFVLKDVCDALGLGNTSRVAGRLDSDDLTLSKVLDNNFAFRNGQGKITPCKTQSTEESSSSPSASTPPVR